MLLLVDAGNTRIKWALLDVCNGMPPLGQWSASGSVARADVRQLAKDWRGLKIGRIMLSNVAGPAVRDELEQAVLRGIGTKPVPMAWFASAPQLGGVRNRYRDPGQLGCDRFAAAIGARALFPARPLIVATCGTATTVDALTAEGDFIGGMILPGLGLMAHSLARNTAQLPQVAPPEQVPATPFADNTADAIVSGCFAAQAGAIERALAAHGRDSAQPVACVLAGGAAAMIAPYLSAPHERVDNLVLIGLQAVAL